MRAKAAMGIGVLAGLLLGFLAGQTVPLAHGQQDGTELDTVVGARPDAAMPGFGGANQYQGFAWGEKGLVLLHTPTGQMWDFENGRWNALPAAPIGPSNKR
jgi:hypothetical protein